MEFYCLGSPIRIATETEDSYTYGKPGWYEKYRSVDDDGTSYESITCSLNSDHRRAGARIGNLQLVLPTRYIGDFIWTILGEGVATDRVVNVFTMNNVTGFRTRDARIAKIKGRKKDDNTPIPTVCELEIIGKGGDAHPDSGIRLLSVCPECKRTRYSSFRNGIIVDESRWDGSDIFAVNGYPSYWLVTDKVKDLIVQNSFTNCAIIPSKNLKWGNYPRPEEPYKYSTKPLAPLSPDGK